MKKANAFVSNAFILCASTVEKDSCFFVKLRRISLRTLQAPSDSHVWFGIIRGIRGALVVPLKRQMTPVSHRHPGNGASQYLCRFVTNRSDHGV